MPYQKKREGDFINRVYKYKLKPNKAQQVALEEMLTTQCCLYNRVLAHRNLQYQALTDKQRRLTTDLRNLAFEASAIEDAVQQMKAQIPIDGLGEQKKRFVTQGRRENDSLARCNYGVCAMTLTRLDKAFQAFFRRVKKGETPGYPQFKSRHHWDTLEFNHYEDGVRLNGNRLSVQHVGDIKVMLYRPLPEGAVIRNVSITRQADGWFACLILEIPFTAPEPREEPVIGIDVGLRAFVMTSDGGVYAPVKHYVKAQDNLAARQQDIARKVKGSHRRRKAGKLLAKQHLHIRNQRKEWHRVVAKELATSAGVIVREELDIQPMTRRPNPAPSETEGEFLPNGTAQKAKLNKGIQDAAWGEFFQALDSAGQRFGAQIVTRPAAYTSQTCSACGHVADPPIDVLKTDTFICTACGHIQDIDVNAAINLRDGYLREKSAATI